MDARRFAEALAVADRLAADPKQRMTGLVFRGNILLAQRNLTAAQAAFDKAVGLEPNNPAVARLARADFFVTSQKYAEAAKDLQAVLASDSKNPAARVKLADIAVRQGKDQGGPQVAGRSDRAVAARCRAPIGFDQASVGGQGFQGCSQRRG